MMITASNVAPGIVLQLYDAFAKGDVDGAIALNLKLYPCFVEWRLKAARSQ